MSQADAEKPSIGVLELLLGAMLVAIIGGVVAGGYAYRKNISAALQEAWMRDLAISTSPPGAKLIYDGRDIGLSPVVVSTASGPHTIVAVMDGYIPASQAISLEFSSRRENIVAAPWIANLTLQRDPLAQSIGMGRTTVPRSATESTSTLSPLPGAETELRKQISDIRNMILANPEDAVRVAAIRDRVALLVDENRAIKEEIREMRSFSVWIVGIAVTTILAFVGFIITLITTNRRSP